MFIYITRQHSGTVVVERIAFATDERCRRNMNYKQQQRGAVLKNLERSRSEKLNKNFQIRRRKRNIF